MSETKQASVFATPATINAFQCLTIASALSLYAKTGLKANQAYTPSAMLNFVNKTTGMHFKRTQYAEAAQYLRTWARAKAEGVSA